jgi:hypothetical protein
MREMVRQTLRRPTNGQVPWEILRTILVFLVQTPLVLWYSRGRIPIHPVVAMLPLVGLLNSKIEKRGPDGW